MALGQLYSQGLDGEAMVAEVLDGVETRLEQDGLGELTPFLQGNLAFPNQHQIAGDLQESSDCFQL